MFLDGLEELGIPILTDPNNGTVAGGMLIPNNISPDNQTRSYTRLNYYDGFIDSRPNFHVITHQHVARVLINAHRDPFPSRDHAPGFWASGVEYLTDGSLNVHTVSCSREVILAAGTVHTPQILEMSGIGDSHILDQFDIPVFINLPGVGNIFQGHPCAGVAYYCESATSFSDFTKNGQTTMPGTFRSMI
jgi:choline dehydrogenase